MSGQNHTTYATEKDSWWRTLSATIALLKHAQTRLDAHTQTIRALEKRVKHLEALATRDDLTGLLNRRGFHEALAVEMDRTRRGHSRGGVMVMIDLDGFKTVNDRYGHAVGDACLRLVGQTLGQDIRTMDAAARPSGDEFIVLLADAETECAALRAQKLGQRLNNLSLAHNGIEIAIQASIGLRSYGQRDDLARILREADDRMYEHKREKTNRTMEPPHTEIQTRAMI